MDKKIIENYSKEIIYISHDGILDPLGQSQIFQYINVLSKEYNFYLITLEKKHNLNDKKKLDNLFNKFLEKNINWKYFQFENIFFLKIFNFFRVLWYLFSLFLRKKIKIIHIRSYLPGFYIIPLKLCFNFKLIFDMRGFLPEEKVDRLHKSFFNYKYIFLKIIEKLLLNYSNEIVTLTYKSKKILKKKFKINKKNITVIRTCVNTSIFKPINKNNSSLVIGYIGNLYGAYNILPIIETFSKLIEIDKNIILKIYTKEEKKNIKNYFLMKNIPNKNYSIESVDNDELIKIVPCFDIGVFNLNKNYSIQASFPTKIGEFLASGVPIVCNNFNEDIEKILSINKIGLIVDFNFEYKYPKVFYNKLIELKNNDKIKYNCRSFCLNELSIEYGTNKYNEIYKKYL